MEKKKPKSEIKSRVVEIDGALWLAYETEDYLLSCMVAGAVIKAGYTAFHRDDGPGSVPHPVYVQCTPRELETIVKRCAKDVLLRRAWQCTYFGNGDGRFTQNGGPPSIFSWAHQFEMYIAKRWWDSDSTLPNLFPGPNAKPPVMERIAAITREHGVFDLEDLYIYSYWLDYLNEYPERMKTWKRWQRKHGPCNALYWQNEAGLKWEAEHSQAEAD